MEESENKPRLNRVPLNVRLAAYVIRECLRITDTLILRCFGWKYESQYCLGKKFYCWIDPVDGKRYDKFKAIEKCEARLNGG